MRPLATPDLTIKGYFCVYLEMSFNCLVESSPASGDAADAQERARIRVGRATRLSSMSVEAFLHSFTSEVIKFAPAARIDLLMDYKHCLASCSLKV